MTSNRFEFTSVTGLSLHNVYMTSPVAKLTSPLMQCGVKISCKRSCLKECRTKAFVRAPDRSENEDILLFCELKVNLCSCDE